jgi:RNA polymerase sigma-70 factor (ECF subfamily)
VPESTRNLLQSVWEDVAPQLARLIGAMGFVRDRREDLLQDVYLAAWKNGPGDADAMQLRRWLFRVTVNRCNLEHRRTNRWQDMWRVLVSGWLRPASAGSNRVASHKDEEREYVHRALAKLKPQARSLLVLRYFMELDSTEIGIILGESDSTVRGQLREARKRLAWELKQVGWRHDE